MEKDLKWWLDDRFGMFIHFGIYASLAGKWNGEEVPGLVEWMQCRKRIPVAEYQKAAMGLTLENFNAKEYAELAKAAGMKYVVFTAKHHDGFAMYDSKCSDYNVVKMCPAHRDVARELAEAVRKAGLTMCFYYSQALDWEDPDAFGNDWDFPEEKKQYRRFLDGKCKKQLKELLTEYGKIGLIWFDMPRGMTVEESLELKAYVKQFQPECLVSGRIHMDPSIGDYSSMGDNEFPSGTIPGHWETPATLNNAWGYRESDHNWKSPEELLRLLIELLSKGMNYLLNIGPKPDGSIPQESIEILKKIGIWVSVNEEAVYGTEATPYQFDFPWGRISQKGNVLYAYLLEKPEMLMIPGIENEILSASLLTSEGRKAIQWEMEETECGKILKIPPFSSENCFYDVIRIELDGVPKVKQGLYQLPGGEIHLYSHMAKLHRKNTEKNVKKEDMEADVLGRKETETAGENIEDVDIAAEKNNLLSEDEFCIDANGNIIHWFDTENFASWEFEVYDPGSYEICVQTRGMKYTPWAGGHIVEAELEGKRIKARLSTGEKAVNAHTRYFEERLTVIGTATIEEAGKKKITLRMLECSQEEKSGLLVTKMLLRPKTTVLKES